MLTNPDLTLDEFEATLRANVARFVVQWRENAAKDPENWPMTMESDFWNAQWCASQDYSGY